MNNNLDGGVLRDEFTRLAQRPRILRHAFVVQVCTNDDPNFEMGAEVAIAQFFSMQRDGRTALMDRKVANLRTRQAYSSFLTKDPVSSPSEEEDFCKDISEFFKLAKSAGQRSGLKSLQPEASTNSGGLRVVRVERIRKLADDREVGVEVGSNPVLFWLEHLHATFDPLGCGVTILESEGEREFRVHCLEHDLFRASAMAIQAIDNDDAPREEPPFPAIVTLDPPEMTLFGVRFQLEPDGAQLMKALAESPIEGISASGLLGGHPERTKNRLPPAIRGLIKSESGKGYKIDFEALEELRQKLSVVPPE